jgi:hypothetical protein
MTKNDDIGQIYLEITDFFKSNACKNEFELRDKLIKAIEKLTGKGAKFEENKVDAQISDVAIETKHYKELGESKKNFNKHVNQIKGYMLKNIFSYGVLTDGEEIYFYKLEPGMTIQEVKTHSNLFDINNFTFLINLIKDEQREKLISNKSLTYDFGFPDENYYIKPFLKHMLNLFLKDKNPKSQLFFSEWEKLFRLSEEDKAHTEEINNRRRALYSIFDIEINSSNEYKSLFIMHTTLSIIVKLLIYFALSKMKNIPYVIPNNRSTQKELKDFFKKIENGEFFQSLGIVNMGKSDFFSWYTEVDWDKEIADDLLLLIQRTSPYRALANADVRDYLQELYENFIPKEIRHSFGEYYTPLWLSNFIVNYFFENVTKKVKGVRAIDPTCGSGTFINSLIDAKKKQGESLHEILDEVVGIDLNPIAVTMAKFNYILNISDIIGNATEIEIPIYLGDSSYVPTIKNIDGINCISYNYYFPPESQIFFPEIVFPIEFVKRKEFIKTINKVEDMVIKDEKLENILDYLFEVIGESLLNPKIKDYISKLIEQIIDYQKKKYNSIWLFIFMNYLKPFAMGKYDFAVGNPPWIRWSVLPDGYKNKIKSDIRNAGLFSKDKNTGGVDLNICALIAYRVLENLVNMNGHLVFLLPKSILNNKSFEGFRNIIAKNIGHIVEILEPEDGLRVFEDTNLPFIIPIIRRLEKSSPDSQQEKVNKEEKPKKKSKKRKLRKNIN